jgi:hypothetical protein
MLIVITPIAMPTGSTLTARCSGIVFRRDHRARRDADRGNALQHGRLRQGIAERYFSPFQHDELQCRAGAPKQRGGRERDLAQLVAPQQAQAVGEVSHQVNRIPARRLVIDAVLGT